MPRFEPADFTPYEGPLWRLIEGQYRPATRKITDSLAEQERLEALLDATKPRVPQDCAHLSYELSTPFRYGLYPKNSRFRRAGPTPGVYYAAEAVLTAAIESAWGSVAFFRASPATPLPGNPVAYAAICVEVRAPFAADLTRPDLAPRGRWDDPDDYRDCLTAADAIRAAGAEAIRYRSVRDPEGRVNVAVLTCRAFAKPQVQASQTWQIYLTRDRVVLNNETGRAQHEFGIGRTALEPV